MFVLIGLDTVTFVASAKPMFCSVIANVKTSPGAGLVIVPMPEMLSMAMATESDGAFTVVVKGKVANVLPLGRGASGLEVWVVIMILRPIVAPSTAPAPTVEGIVTRTYSC